MHGWIGWLAHNPVAANLLMVLLVVSGVIATTTIRVEVFPEVPLDEVGIQVTYLGAGPEEVESAVVTRVEEAVEGIDGVDGVRSTAAEGSARRSRPAPHAYGRSFWRRPGRTISAISRRRSATSRCGRAAAP